MTGANPSEPKAWLVRGSKNAAFDQWMLDQGLTGIDFWEVPSLADVGDLPAMREVVRTAMPALTSGAVGNYAAQLFAFSSRISVGDLVILPVRHTAKLAFGVVAGPYQYREGHGTLNHVRAIEWGRTDVSRTAINQDLLYSLGAFSTVVQISRNDAAWRLWQVAKGAETDPGARGGITPTTAPTDVDAVDSDDAIAEEGFDILRYSKDRVLGRIRERFAGHRLSNLVAAILEAEGMTCKVSPPGADGGIDIIAGSGVLGISAPTIIVQVKSQPSAVGSEVLDQLGGVVGQHQADHGLLVAMGGLTKPARDKVAAQRLKVAVWDEEEVLNRIYKHYAALPAEFKEDIPLTLAWVIDEAGAA